VSKTQIPTHVPLHLSARQVAELIVSSNDGGTPDEGYTQKVFLLQGSESTPLVWAFATYGAVCNVHVQFADGISEDKYARARSIVEKLQSLPKVGAHLSAGKCAQPQFAPLEHYKPRIPAAAGG
jgi:hypothetical protein